MASRTNRRLRAALVAVVAGMTMLVGPGAEVAGAAPSVTVTPNTDLTAYTDVTVEVDDLTPGGNVVITQCSPTRCVSPIHFVVGTVQQFNTANAKNVVVDDSGVASIVLRLSNTVGNEVCWADRCRIGVFPAGTVVQDPDFPPAYPYMFAPIVSAPTYTAPLSFVSGMTVTPSADLMDKQPVVVNGTTPAPYAEFLLQQCAADACVEPSSSGVPFMPHNATNVVSAPDGRFEGSLLLSRVLTTSSGTFDCAAVECSIRVLSLAPEVQEVDRAPISFAPTGTYQWPEATLNVSTPDARGAIDGGRANVTGAGYSQWYWVHHTMGAAASVETCRSVPDPDPAVDCVSVPVDMFGLWRGDVALVPGGRALASDNSTARTVRRIALPSGEWDCAVAGCTIALSQSGNPVSNRVPLTWAPGWAPWRSANHFFDDGFRRVRGAAISAAERARLTAALTDRSASAADVLLQAALVGDADERSSVAVVGDTVRMYRAFFDRYADNGGLQYWVGRRRSGMTGAQMARAFGGTPEFRAVYGSVSNGEVVRRAYRNTLGREGEAGGIAYWTDRLNQGMARATLIHNFSRSPELRYREADRVAITIVAFELAGRTATGAERTGDPTDSLDAWAGRPAAGIADILAGDITIRG